MLISFLFLISTAHAGELFDMHRNARALGMGNAYVSIVDDEDSIFFNPAGIGANSGIYWSLIDINAGINDVDAITNFADLGDSSTFSSTLNELYGNPIWAGGGGKTALLMPFFAAAYYFDLDMSVAVNNRPATNMDVNIVVDEGIALGTGFSVGFFSFGAVAKRITRTGARRNYGAATIASIVNGSSPDVIFEDYSNEGIGYSLDLGFNVGFDNVVAPNFSFVYKNVGDTTFRTSSTLIEEPPKDEQEMIFGSSLVFNLPLVSISPSVDIRHLDTSGVQFGKKVHMGVEIGLPLVDIRAGFHQGYFSYGAGLNLGFMRVDAASWGVELGEYPGQLEDRRYMVQATIRFGFDVGIGGSEASAARSGDGGGSSSAAAGASGKSGRSGAFRRVKRRR